MADKPSMTVPQQESCVKLLRALREVRQLEHLLELASQVRMPSSSSGGQCMMEPSVAEDLYPKPSSQMPVMPKYPKAKLHQWTDDCPPSSENLDKWSRTRCDLPKVRKLDKSYIERIGGCFLSQR